MEFAIKANKGLTPFTRKHLETLVLDLNLTVLPFSAEHSMGLFGLPAHHHDPFDRALISIALVESVLLVARDQEFKKYKGAADDLVKGWEPAGLCRFADPGLL